MPYRIPEARYTIIEEEVDQMLQEEILKESYSPWSSSVMVALKLDCSLRLCINFWKLNGISEFY